MLIKASLSNAIITATVIATDDDLCLAVHSGPLLCAQNCGVAPGSLLLIQDGDPPTVVGVLGTFQTYALVAVDIERVRRDLPNHSWADAGPNLTALWARGMSPEDMQELLESKYPGKILLCEPSKVDITKFFMVSVGDHSA